MVIVDQAASTHHVKSLVSSRRVFTRRLADVGGGAAAAVLGEEYMSRTFQPRIGKRKRVRSIAPVHVVAIRSRSRCGRRACSLAGLVVRDVAGGGWRG